MKVERVSMSRRQFLITSIASSLGLSSCYRSEVTGGEPNNTDFTPSVAAEPQPPNMHSDNVLYYQRDDESYAKYQQGFNKRIKKSPRIIAVCLNEQGIQEAVRYARYHKLPIAIKSGGHSFEGYSVNDNGLVIELSRMNHLTYDESNGLLTAGPGCKLGNVYEYLAQFGRIIPAGSCGGVGLAGLTLGGGYGFFSRKLGLTCDCLQQIRLVDGLAKAHQAETNDKLMWASKGGGNGNFAVASRFVFKTHPSPENFTSYLSKYQRLNSEQARQAARLWFELMPSLPNSCYGSFILGHRTCTFLITDTEDQPSPELQHILDKIQEKASKIYTPKKAPLIKAIKRYEGRPGPLYFKNVSAGYYKDFSDLDAVFIRMHQRMKQQASMLLQINTLGGAISDPQLQSSAAYPHRQMPYLGELQVYYERESQQQKAVQSVDDIQALLSGSGINKHYRNYPDISLANWQQAYYGNSYAMLQQLKKQYDPDNLFQYPQSVELPN